MNLISINKNGVVKPLELNRKELIKKFNIHSRDLRPVWLIGQVGTLFTRKNILIINLGLIKLLIATKKVLVFNCDNTDIQKKFIPYLSEKLENDKGTVDFEIKVLDAVFAYKLEKLNKEIAPLKRKIDKTLSALDENPNDRLLGDLLLLKKQLSRFQITVTENAEASLEVLEEDETLAEFCISQNERDEEIIDFDEMESVLDSFSEQIEQISYQLTDMKENIDDTQEIFSLKLHTRRNSIIRIDLLVTVITGILSLLAVITGFYGMNIKNNLENNANAFAFMALAFGLLFFVILLIFWWNLRRKSIL